MKKVVFSALTFFALALPQMSFAEQGFVDDANVIGMMTTPGVYGGCMVQLSKRIDGILITGIYRSGRAKIHMPAL